MTLAAPITEPLSPEQTSFVPQAEHQVEVGSSGLGALVDRLQSRLGIKNVMRFSLRESYIPERNATPVPVFHDGLSTLLSPSTCPRPIRLLPRPETIETTAMVPDGPPVMFRWRRVLYQISCAEGPERIAPEWWLKAASWNASYDTKTRDYYRLEDTEGRRYWVFREGLYRIGGEEPRSSPCWHIHGLFA